jgi:CBS-domain-containing membrane protein
MIFVIAKNYRYDYSYGQPVRILQPPSSDDLQPVLKEMKAYVDVTEKDLQKIYGLALRYPRERITPRSPVKGVMSRNVITVKCTADLREGLRILFDNKISGMRWLTAKTALSAASAGLTF